MPDLTIEYYQQCVPTYFTEINGYEVCSEYGREWCTCPDYKYRKKKQGKVCKHIKQVQEKECGWHGSYFERQTEEQEKNYICPRCGGPTEVVRVGV